MSFLEPDDKAFDNEDWVETNEPIDCERRVISGSLWKDCGDLNLAGGSFGKYSLGVLDADETFVADLKSSDLCTPLLLDFTRECGNGYARVF